MFGHGEGVGKDSDFFDLRFRFRCPASCVDRLVWAAFLNSGEPMWRMSTRDWSWSAGAKKVRPALLGGLRRKRSK